MESVEVLDLLSGSISLVNGVTTPHKRWGGTCFTMPGPHIMITGGMDQLFLPHANTDLLNTVTQEWTEGPSFPHPIAGGEGAILGGSPTIFGGFSGLGLSKEVASFDENIWDTRTEKLDSSRISGLAVSVPDDIFAQC